MTKKFVLTALAAVVGGIAIEATTGIGKKSFEKIKGLKNNNEGSAAAEALGVGTTAPTDQNNQGMPKFGNPQPQKA